MMAVFVNQSACFVNLINFCLRSRLNSNLGRIALLPRKPRPGRIGRDPEQEGFDGDLPARPLDAFELHPALEALGVGPHFSSLVSQLLNRKRLTP